MRWGTLAIGTLLVLGFHSVPIANADESHEPSENGAGEEAGPHGREYRVTLAPEGFAPVFGSKADSTLDYSLPLLRVFDRAGDQISCHSNSKRDCFLRSSRAPRNPVSIS